MTTDKPSGAHNGARPGQAEGLPRGEDVRSVGERLAALDAAIARGLADVEAGRVKPIDEAFAKIRARLGGTGEGSSEAG